MSMSKQLVSMSLKKLKFKVKLIFSFNRILKYIYLKVQEIKTFFHADENVFFVFFSNETERIVVVMTKKVKHFINNWY